MIAKNGSPASDVSLRFAREQGFFDKSVVIRGVLTAVLFLSLFYFVHFRDVRVEVLEMGTVAERYMVAQVDFDFLDAETTELYKQEAVRDIGKVFKVTEKSLRANRHAYEQYIKENQNWRRQAESTTFEELYQALDVLEDHLGRIRFTDPRTLQKMRDMGLKITDFQVYIPPDTENAVELPPRMWTNIRRNAFGEGVVQSGTVDFLIKSFQTREWTLEEDFSERTRLTQVVRGRVPDKYTRISAGDRIIDHGDTVTSRHLAMLQAMKRELGEQRNLWHPSTFFGSVILAGVLVAVSFFYFRAYHPDLLKSNRKLFLLFILLVLSLMMSKSTEYLLLHTRINLLDFVRYPLFVPLAAVLLTSLFNPGIAFYGSVFLSLILSMTLALERPGFLMVNLLTALVMILASASLRQRREIFGVCAKGGATCLTMLIALHCYQGSWWSVTLVADGVSTVFFMALTAVLAVGLLPFLESTFHILTDVALMEYMDPNNEMLRRLSIEAPGTYQHSLVVGNLSEASASAIGANGLFCRASTLYHDIGKLTTPHYFTENQQGEMNMHQLLTPLESAQVIMAHVGEGVAMARKMGLPEQFIDVIKEHHGTTLVYYFFHQQLEQMGGDHSLVPEADFRYAGPKPRTKESAIIMIADSMEAASRSLDEVNEEVLTDLIDRLVRDKADDGQFDECELTFEELGVVKRAMVKTLLAARHSRIKYPEREQAAPANIESPVETFNSPADKQ